MNQEDLTNHRHKGLTIAALFPVALDTLFLLFVTALTGIDSVNWPVSLLIWLCLLISGLGVLSHHKKWNIAAWLSMATLILISIPMGYHDYVQWSSTKVCLGWSLYFIVIYIIRRRLDRKHPHNQK